MKKNVVIEMSLSVESGSWEKKFAYGNQNMVGAQDILKNLNINTLCLHSWNRVLAVDYVEKHL